ncbi:DUF423 domain-containing protein [Lysobacter sp. A3-1-A15]|uniref:DUF423 domain-containing protein n=1 Tax=Novilysobacter viscosus TaxID=3098602 RepID=UPI002EDA8679
MSEPSPAPGHLLRRQPRLLPALGALLAGGSVALSAYAAHASGGEAQARLQLAALMAFGHGIALMAVGMQGTGRAVRGCLVAMLLGVLLFSGSLVLSHALGMSAPFAPVGGGLMIAAWLALALVFALGRFRS